MSRIQDQIDSIAARGIAAIEAGKTLLPTLAPLHQTAVDCVVGNKTLFVTTAARHPRTKFPSYNF